MPTPRPETPPYDPTQEWIGVVRGATGDVPFRLCVRADGLALRWSFYDDGGGAWAHHEHPMAAVVGAALQRHLARLRHHANA